MLNLIPEIKEEEKIWFPAIVLNNGKLEFDEDLFGGLLDQQDLRYQISFTRNPDLIDQYIALRKRLYEADPRFIGFRYYSGIGGENYFDKDTQMIVLHNGNRCFGGACLRISTPERPVILTLENDILPEPGKYYFSIKDRFPELELERNAYAEIDLISLHPDLRTKEAVTNIFEVAIKHCIRNGVRHMFGITDSYRARLYKQVVNSLGFEMNTHNTLDIPLRPEYEGVKMHLLHGHITQFNNTELCPRAKSIAELIRQYEVIG